MTTLSDEELCALARQGEGGAEAVLAERYLALVRSCARPYFLSGGSAEDVTQEGMLGLIVAMREFEPQRGTFKSFAERCIRNRILDSMRAANRAKHYPLNTYISIDPFSFENGEHLSWPDAPGPEQQVLEKESYTERLREISSRLSGFENKVLGLYLNGLSTVEIAQRLCKPRKSVENAVQRVRQKLTRHIQSGEYGQ